MLKLCVFAAALVAVVICVPLKHQSEKVHIRGKNLSAHNSSFVLLQALCSKYVIDCVVE